MSKKERDWTCKNGAANSSDAFQFLSKEVARIIRSSAFSLLNGDSETVGVVIMARLAHEYRLAPIEEKRLHVKD